MPEHDLDLCCQYAAFDQLISRQGSTEVYETKAAQCVYVFACECAKYIAFFDDFLFSLKFP